MLLWNLSNLHAFTAAALLLSIFLAALPLIYDRHSTSTNISSRRHPQHPHSSHPSARANLIIIFHFLWARCCACTRSRPRYERNRAKNILFGQRVAQFIYNYCFVWVWMRACDKYDPSIDLSTHRQNLCDLLGWRTKIPITIRANLRH